MMLPGILLALFVFVSVNLCTERLSQAQERVRQREAHPESKCE